MGMRPKEVTFVVQRYDHVTHLMVNFEDNEVYDSKADRMYYLERKQEWPTFFFQTDYGYFRVIEIYNPDRPNDYLLEECTWNKRGYAQ